MENCAVFKTAQNPFNIKWCMLPVALGLQSFVVAWTYIELSLNQILDLQYLKKTAPFWVLCHFLLTPLPESKCPLMNITQDLLWDYDFLTKSETVFKKLQLSGTFSEDANVYPEVLFNDVRLLADLVSVSNDGNRIPMLKKDLHSNDLLKEYCQL